MRMDMRISHNRVGTMLVYLLALMTIATGSGCSQPRGELFPEIESPPVWPAPPDEPKIKYIGSLSTEEDLKREQSWLQGLENAIFGKKKIGVLLNPYSVVIDDNERLFVGDTAGNVVHMLDLKSRKYKQISELEKGKELLKPVALALSQDALYISDSVLAEIHVLDKNGKFQFSFGGGKLKRPTGIAFYKKTGRLYVVDTARHVIDVFDKNGRFIYEFGARGDSAGEFNYPTQLCIDKAGRLYVSDTLNYRIQVFSSDGKFIKMFGSQGKYPGNFAHPCGISTDDVGHIYVVDRQFENVQIFDSDGRILIAFGQEGSGLSQFWLPAGIFIDSQNRIFVADSFNKRIQIFELLKENGL